jgi:hypothetical protein
MNGIESICRICLNVENTHYEYNLRAMKEEGISLEDIKKRLGHTELDDKDSIKDSNDIQIAPN